MVIMTGVRVEYEYRPHKAVPVVSQEKGSMTLDESPPSFDYGVMRNAGPRGGPGGGGNVLEGPEARRQSASVLPGTSGAGPSGGAEAPPCPS